jgi:FKBP-type peptidyl-prolyl cis-trans isomerase FkpA
MTRTHATLAAVAALVLGATAAAAEPAKGADLTTAEDKAFYALGVSMSQQLATFSPTEHELEMVKAGLTDAMMKRPLKAELDANRAKLQELAQTRATAAAETEKKASQPFLEKAAAEKGAVKTDSGAIVQEITAGAGESPQASDRVKVHYTGTLIDGTVFDSSVTRGEPATFPLGGVIKCWTEGLQKMKVGGKSKLICPSDIAYGDRGRPPTIKPGATLVFEIELLEIVR